MDLIGCRHAKSHPCVLGTAGLHEPEDYVFLDIETLGLFSRPIILFGVGTIEKATLKSISTCCGISMRNSRH